MADARATSSGHGMTPRGLVARPRSIMLYPMVVVVLSAFKTTAEIYTHAVLPAAEFNLTNVETVWRETTFPRYLANSLIVTGIVGRRDRGRGHDGGLCARPLQLPRQRLDLSVLPVRPDAAAEARDHPALHPAHVARSHRYARRPRGGLHGDGPALGGLHPDRLSAQRCRGSSRNPRASTAPARRGSCGRSCCRWPARQW